MLALSVALIVVVVSGCGSSTGSVVGDGRVVVRIQLTTFTDRGSGRATAHAQSFSLVCDPTSGTLPLAARVCRDIRRYPGPMLDPPRARSVCLGLLNGPALTIVATTGGKTTRFGGEPFCDWPGGTALGVYYEAASQDGRTLARIEPRLRCDEAPVLHESGDSVDACVHGLWTPHSEQLIREAEQAPEIAALQPARLFPRDIGLQDCTIPAGGPSPGGQRAGLCQVTIKNVWSSPAVTFVEEWTLAASATVGNGNRVARHVWRVAIGQRGATVVSESGAIPPQQWK